jgi:hypothetical protein
VFIDLVSLKKSILALSASEDEGTVLYLQTGGVVVNVCYVKSL